MPGNIQYISQKFPDFLFFLNLANDTVEDALKRFFQISNLNQISTDKLIENVTNSNEVKKSELINLLRNKCFFSYMDFALRLIQAFTKDFIIENSLSSTALAILTVKKKLRVPVFFWDSFTNQRVETEETEETDFFFRSIIPEFVNDVVEITPTHLSKRIESLVNFETLSRKNSPVSKSTIRVFVLKFSNKARNYSESNFILTLIAQTIRHITKRNDWVPQQSIFLHMGELFRLIGLGKRYLDEGWSFDLQGEILQHMIFLVRRLGLFHHQIIQPELNHLKQMWQMKYIPQLTAVSPDQETSSGDHLKQSFLQKVSVPHSQFLLYPDYQKWIYDSHYFVLSRPLHMFIQSNLRFYANRSFNVFEMRIILASIATQITMSIQSPKDKQTIQQENFSQIKFDKWISIASNDGNIH